MSKVENKNSNTLNKFLINCPGLAGEIARYINSTLDTDQPGIALATAISFVGALKSDRIVSPMGIAPSIYTCAIAPSGVGKSKAQQAISDICTTCKLDNIMMGRPASDSGILKALQDEPRRFLIWDEFGLALSEMSKSTASYRVAILSTLMDLFSSAGRKFVGAQYSKQQRVDIDKPLLSICAASTPVRFYGALTKDFVEDGFLSRWLIFEGDVSIDFRDVSIEPIPTTIIETVMDLDAGVPKTSGNLASIIEKEQALLEFEDETDHLLLKDNARAKMRKAKNETERIFWSRSYEHTIKLCMIFAEKSGLIFSPHVIFAWDLVEHLMTQMIERCSTSIHDTQREREADKRARKFIELIAPGEYTPTRDLVKKAINQRFSKIEREQRIADALTSGEWVETTRTNPDTLRENKFYHRPE